MSSVSNTSHSLSIENGSLGLESTFPLPLKPPASVKLNGKVFYSAAPIESSEHSSALDESSVNSTSFRTVPGILSENSVVSSSASLSNQTWGSVHTGTATRDASITSCRSVKPRVFPAKLRQRGPFSMVGPLLPTTMGLPPIQSRQQKRDILASYRTRRKKLQQNYNTISKDDVKHHNEERLNGIIKHSLEKKKGEDQSSRRSIRTTSQVTLSTIKMRRSSTISSQQSEEDARREKIMSLKGIDKLNFLVEGLNAIDGVDSYKELVPKILWKRKHKRNHRAVRRKNGLTLIGEEEGVNRLGMKPAARMHEREEEPLTDETWLKDAIRTLRRSEQEKNERMNLDKLEEQNIVRRSKRYQKSMLKMRKRVSEEIFMDNPFQRLGLNEGAE